MKLANLLETLSDYQVYGDTNKTVDAISDDSRIVTKGGLFVAVEGLTADGHDFISEVIKKGVNVVVGEKEPEPNWLKEVTYVKLQNSQKGLGLLASAWYGYPSTNLKVIGITGTDGKTTTATLLWWILKVAQKKVGLITSVAAKIGNKNFDTGFHVTNPAPLALQQFLKLMVEKKCEYAILEVTSHGLDQERVAGVKFDIGVLTNITHEHIDYHKTYENYLKTKAKLFKAVSSAILNKEDSSFAKIKQTLTKKVQVVPYDHESLKHKVKDAVFRKFPQMYNVLNAAAAISAAKVLGVNDDAIVAAINTFPGVPGRMEEVANSKGFRIIVDFAHTPNALESVLGTLKNELSEGTRLISIFGCASERDIAKRPMMGEISTRIADISIFTAEDPRKENVENIINQIVNGVKKSDAFEADRSSFHLVAKRKYYFRIPERGEAISFAIQKLAGRGDTIVICGKGHEKSMAYNGVEYPWSDQEAVKIALKGGVMRIGHL